MGNAKNWMVQVGIADISGKMAQMLQLEKNAWLLITDNKETTWESV
jgi:hypothetical protein